MVGFTMRIKLSNTGYMNSRLCLAAAACNQI